MQVEIGFCPDVCNKQPRATYIEIVANFAAQVPIFANTINDQPEQLVWSRFTWPPSARSQHYESRVKYLSDFPYSQYNQRRDFKMEKDVTSPLGYWRSATGLRMQEVHTTSRQYIRALVQREYTCTNCPTHACCPSTWLCTRFVQHRYRYCAARHGSPFQRSEAVPVEFGGALVLVVSGTDYFSGT